MFRFFGIHTVPGEGEESATWLELFFDLIYVAILIELGSRLSGNLTLQGTAEFALLFIPIWWSWLAVVFYTRYFPTDDIGQRFLTIAYMAAMILLAFEIHGVTGATASTFILTYAATKFLVALMYARAWYQYRDYRQLSGHHAVVYLFMGIVWVLIAYLAPNNFWLWGVAVTLDVFAPVLIKVAHRLRNIPELVHPPMKLHYMMHRFGELTIIVLGEFFIKLISSSSGLEVSTANWLIGLCLLGISVSLWWLYFDHLGHAGLTEAGSRIGVWIYTHYPLLAAITAYGVVGTKVFAALPSEPLSDDRRYLLTFTVALAVFALGVIEWSSREHAGVMARRYQFGIRTVSAALLVALGLFGGQLGAGLLVAIVGTILLIQVGLDIAARLRESGPTLTKILSRSPKHIRKIPNSISATML